MAISFVLTHWTGRADRFSQKGYAMEALVAELGAYFLRRYFSVANQPRPDHAAYNANWLAVLKPDTQAIFTAADNHRPTTLKIVWHYPPSPLTFLTVQGHGHFPAA